MTWARSSLPLKKKFNMSIDMGHPSRVPFGLLKYFLSIDSLSMDFHQPLRYFSKYEFLLYKFPLTSYKNFLSMKSFISHLTLLGIFLSMDSFMVPLYIL